MLTTCRHLLVWIRSGVPNDQPFPKEAPPGRELAKLDLERHHSHLAETNSEVLVLPQAAPGARAAKSQNLLEPFTVTTGGHFQKAVARLTQLGFPALPNLQAPSPQTTSTV